MYAWITCVDKDALKESSYNMENWQTEVSRQSKRNGREERRNYRPLTILSVASKAYGVAIYYQLDRQTRQRNQWSYGETELLLFHLPEEGKCAMNQGR